MQGRGHKIREGKKKALEAPTASEIGFNMAQIPDQSALSRSHELENATLSLALLKPQIEPIVFVVQDVNERYKEVVKSWSPNSTGSNSRMSALCFRVAEEAMEGKAVIYLWMEHCTI